MNSQLLSDVTHFDVCHTIKTNLRTNRVLLKLITTSKAMLHSEAQYGSCPDCINFINHGDQAIPNLLKWKRDLGWVDNEAVSTQLREVGIGDSSVMRVINGTTRVFVCFKKISSLTDSLLSL